MPKTIRELRDASFLTQFELAAMVGVRPETISLWERGERRPRPVHLRKLAEVFKIKPNEIELVESEGKEAA
jgi:transcriptional regulator with XRE-family HTH domain